MNKKIGIVGGDLRIIRLTESFAKEEFIVYTYGLEKNIFPYKNILKCEAIENIDSNYIISGIPFSKDGAYVYAPFTNKKIEIEDMLEKIQNKTLIAGAINKNIKEKANKIKIIDLMEDEKLTMQNIIPTVEGAIQIAMENTEFTINNSNCLVLGFGRIGKLLCKTLKDLGAKVSCVARKESDLIWIKTLGYNPVSIGNLEEKLSNKYEIIFNTIPALILDSKKLEILSLDKPLIIELASAPGGIDSERAKEYNINVIKALGLPGKVAPLTAAKYIKESLDEILE